MKNTDFKYLKKWIHPKYYYGKIWPEYYVFLGRNRDSDCLEESNFRCGLKELGGEDGDLVVVVREGHWLFGWVEWIGIHQDAEDKLKIAEDILKKLDAYPVLNEDDYSLLELEQNENDEDIQN